MNNPIGVCLDRNPFSTTDELVATVAGLGFDRIEWFEMDDKAPWSAPEVAAYHRALTHRCGIIPQYHSPYQGPMDYASVDGRLRTAAGIAKLLGVCMDRCERLGASLMTVHLGSCAKADEREEARENVLEGLRLALPEIGRRRIKIAVENHTQAIIESSLGDQPEDFDWLLGKLESEWIGMTLDVGHAFINGQMEAFLSRPFDRIFNMHLHDNNGEQDEHLPMGEGKVPWDEFLGAVREKAYSGPLTLEFFGTAEQYGRSITMLKQMIVED